MARVFDRLHCLYPRALPTHTPHLSPPPRPIREWGSFHLPPPLPITSLFLLSFWHSGLVSSTLARPSSNLHPPSGQTLLKKRVVGRLAFLHSLDNLPALAPLYVSHRDAFVLC